jgi:hypothetical protein
MKTQEESGTPDNDSISAGVNQAALSRKQFLQRMGVAGAGLALGSQLDAAGAQTQGAAGSAAPNGRPAGGMAPPAPAGVPTIGAAPGESPLYTLNVRGFGARGDGKTDDTRAFQSAISEAGSRGGGTVFVPQGRFLIASHLNLPAHVTLRGVSEIPDTPDGNWGSVLLAVEGQGAANGTPFITMNRASALKGMTIFYPEQKMPVPVAYPWTVRGNGDNISILDCLFVNPYQAIDFGTNPCGRHFIQNLYAHALYRGLFVDQCYDIGRVTNVHFWPFASQDQKHFDWLSQNAIAFQFGRTDWQYLIGCFTIFYKIGYHFADFGHGPGNVLLSNSGADVGNVTAQVDATQAWAGVTFVNAQMNGTVQVAKSNEGPVKFTGSSFYGSGKTDSNAIIEGSGRVSFDNCHFTWWDQNARDAPSLRVKGGNVGVSNCEFFGARNHIVLENEVRSATIIGTHFRGAPRITNHSQGQVHLIGNTDTVAPPPVKLNRRFFNSFEAGQPQPILNRVEVSAHPGEYSLRLAGGGRTGNALFIRGNQTDKAKGPGTAYFRVFEVNIPIRANTVFRYWIRANDAEGRFCGLDLVFDGAKAPLALREITTAKDLEGQRMHPAYERGDVGQWVRIESPIGKWVAGRTITAILAAHDGANTGPFEAAFDDIEIGEPQG